LNLRHTFLLKGVTKPIRLIRKFIIYYLFCSDASRSALLWGAQVAHCHDLNTLYAGKILKKSTNKLHVIYDSHELWVHRNRVGARVILERYIDSLAEKNWIRSADRVITVCDSIAEWLKETYPSILNPMVIRNMPELVDDKVKPTLPIKKRLGIPDGDLVILGYGDKEYVDSLKQLIEGLNVSKQVIFCDAVEHEKVASFIYGADLSLVCIEPVCLSYEFALPNKLFESIQAGVPVLASSLVEIEKIVNGYGVGICFQSEDDMYLKLDQLEEEQLEHWRNNIHDCKSVLSWNQERSKLISLYAGLAV